MPLAVMPDRLRLIRCGIGQESYGLEMDWVRGIERGDQVQWADIENGRVGMLPEQDGGVPVFSLAKLLGRPFTNRGSQHSVILLQGPQPWALLVDRVSQVIHVAADAVDPVPFALINERVERFHAVARHDGELLLLLSPDRLRDVLLTPDIPASASRQGKRPPRSLDAGELESISPNPGRLILFRPLAGRRSNRPISCALSITQVLEILEAPPLAPVPSAPDFVLGLARWHDESVPVLDLAMCLGLPSTDLEDRSRLLVACGCDPSQLIAFPVQSSIRILRLPLPHLVCTRDLGLNEGLILSAFEMKNETMILLDLEAFLHLAK
ncbi:MAG: chemotaxis protein CheW [Gemmataceae bacterium]